MKLNADTYLREVEALAQWLNSEAAYFEQLHDQWGHSHHLTTAARLQDLADELLFARGVHWEPLVEAMVDPDDFFVSAGENVSSYLTGWIRKAGSNRLAYTGLLAAARDDKRAIDPSSVTDSSATGPAPYMRTGRAVGAWS